MHSPDPHSGRYVGFSKDSRLPAEFDLTGVLFSGGLANHLECLVVRFSDGYYLEDQDMWNMSGLFRDVLLYAVPQQLSIADYSWSLPRLEPDGSSAATLAVAVDLLWDPCELRELRGDHAASYRSHLEGDWILTARLFEEGVLVSSSAPSPSTHVFAFDVAAPQPTSHQSAAVPVPAAGTGPMVRVQQTLAVSAPTLWSAERPHLYTLVLSLRSAHDGSCAQAESCRVGLRSVAVSSGLLRVNGRPITVRGVNMHEHDPYRGHAVTPQLQEADVCLLKRHNFNALRLSHYPHSPWLYELCSVYGLFVVDEANLETHGMTPYVGALANDPAWEQAMLLRATRMFERDKAQPCIIGWSLGNESGYGEAHDKMAAWLRRADASRVVLYEPASYGPRTGSASAATDVLCPMYARVSDCVALSNLFPEMPLIQSEYSHSMGNSGGNLDAYWESYRSVPRLQGGFIWDWVDQGVAVEDSQGRARWAYGGDFGEAVHDANFCLNGLNWPDRGLGAALLALPAYQAARERGKWGVLAAPSSGASYGCGEGAAAQAAPLNVDGAAAKPALLEAKQCMACFDATLVSVSGPRASSSHRCSDDAAVLALLGSDAVETAPSSMECSARFSIINLYDHIEDLLTELHFDALLLCDGLLLSRAKLSRSASSVVHPSELGPRLGGGGRHSMQELECEAVVPLSAHDPALLPFSLDPALSAAAGGQAVDGRAVLFGVTFPESLLTSERALSPLDAQPSVNLSRHCSRSSRWTALHGEGDRWGVLLVGRLAASQPWAPKGYPLGFKHLPLPSFSPPPLPAEPAGTTRATLEMFAEGGCIVVECGFSRVVIGGSSGLPSALQSGGVNVLATEDQLGGVSPSRLQLHRAPTDNDRGGYKFMWEAVGLTQEMAVVLPRARAADDLPVAFTSLRGSGSFSYESGGGVLFESIGQEGGGGVCCSWTLRPRGVDRLRLRLVRLVEAFRRDPAAEQTVVAVQRFEEEAYLHRLAAAALLGRESIVSMAPSGKKSVIVKMWKPSFHICSTLPRAEQRSVGPFLTRESELERSQSLREALARAEAELLDQFDVPCSAIYSVSAGGGIVMRLSVDASRLQTVSLPRIGLQLQLSPLLDSCCWRGAGPHECYPDRKASCVNSVHCAPLRSLHVPYIKPSENGSRADCEWLQLWCSQEGGGGATNASEAPQVNEQPDEPSIGGSTPRRAPLAAASARFAQSMEGASAFAAASTAAARAVAHGTTLRISCSKPFNFSAQPYTTEDLSLVSNCCLLHACPRGFSSLNIDPFLMGVGGDDSWTSCVHDKYLLPVGKFSFEVNFDFNV